MKSTPLFTRPHALVGMVHLRALPGTPQSRLAVREIVEIAVTEARQLASAGFDALLVENMHDVPYLPDASAADTVAPFAVATAAVVQAVKIPVGLQVLSGANAAALAIAHASGAAFIRAEGFVFAAVADEGLVATGCAGHLLRERRRLGADGIRVLADCRKKHASHALTADLDIAAWIRAAEFFSADGVIVTGDETAMPPDQGELRRARAAARGSLLVGSGTTPENVSNILALADAAIVGSTLKRDGLWSNELDADRVAALVRARDRIRPSVEGRSV
jgi:membrane complex biogenesis BtpA family protein